jgi:DNA-directed RNA polymerase subunit RPC12/RpoP
MQSEKFSSMSTMTVEALMVHWADRKIFADGTATMRPVCSKCGAPLWLIRIEPDKPGFARRTFECPRCQSRISEAIELEKRAS